MHIAILTFDEFNELDSLIALGILRLAARADWRVSIASPTARVTSMNGVVMESQATLEEACEADAVIVGSGLATRRIVENPDLLGRLKFDPQRQLVGAQCSGALVLARLGLLNGIPACTDLTTKPWVQQAGIETLNQPFFAKGNIATAGGCLGSHYLAAWMIARLASIEAAEKAIHYVAPVGEKEQYVSRAMHNIRPYLPKTGENIAAAEAVKAAS